MTITGALVTTSDAAAGAEVRYDEWMRTARATALRAIDGVADVRHYRASPELQSLRGANPAEPFAPGRSRSLEIVLLDGDPLATAKVIRDLDPSPGAPAEVRYSEVFRLRWVMRAGGSKVDHDEARRPHVGVQLALGEVLDDAMRPVVADWYEEIHAPDALEVAGFDRALRFTSEERDRRHLVMFFLVDDPATCIERVRAVIPAWRAAGRTPSPGGASKGLVNGPFARFDE
jgi:hypothetical protein